MSRLTHIFHNENTDAGYTLRIIGRGDRYGKKWAQVHDSDALIAEFYDRRFAVEDDPADGRILGQFVARFSLDKLLQEGPDGRSQFERPLALDVDMPTWVVPGTGMQSCRRVLAMAGLAQAMPGPLDPQVAIIIGPEDTSFVFDDSTEGLDAKILTAIPRVRSGGGLNLSVPDAILRLCNEQELTVRRASAQAYCDEGAPVTHAAILSHGNHRAGMTASSALNLALPVRHFIVAAGFSDPREEHLDPLLRSLRETPGMICDLAGPDIQALTGVVALEPVS